MTGMIIIAAGVILIILGTVLLIYFHRISPLNYRPKNISTDTNADENKNSRTEKGEFNNQQETVLHVKDKESEFGENEETLLDTESDEFNSDEETLLHK